MSSPPSVTPKWMSDADIHKYLAKTALRALSSPSSELPPTLPACRATGDIDSATSGDCALPGGGARPSDCNFGVYLPHHLAVVDAVSPGMQHTAAPSSAMWIRSSGPHTADGCAVKVLEGACRAVLCMSLCVTRQCRSSSSLGQLANQLTELNGACPITRSWQSSR